MKRLLQADVQGHMIGEVDTATFVGEVWGLDSKTIDAITNINFYDDQTVRDLMTAYSNVLTNMAKQEYELHEPFRKLAGKLLEMICEKLDTNPTIRTEFWDTEGKKSLSTKLDYKYLVGTTRKPDLLDVFKQPDEYKPVWDDVRCSFEFKKPDYKKGSKLDSVRRVLDFSNRSKSSVGDSEDQEATSSFETTIQSGEKRGASTISGDTDLSGTNRKKRKVAATLEDAQLFTYALETLATGSRHYTTAFLIDGTFVTVWYLDRSLIGRTVTFHFFSNAAGITSLALALFALSQADRKHIGFDPHLYKLELGKPGKPITRSCIIDIPPIHATVVNKCYMFPKSGSAPQFAFPVVGLIYRYAGVVGRGTTVVSVLVAILDNIVRANLHVLKMSWQYSTRKHEADIISHLRTVLPKYWSKFLPDPVFSAVYTAAELKLPNVGLRQAAAQYAKNNDEHVEGISRDLHVIVNPAYKNIWKARNVDEFKRAFLDCLECHYHAYNSGNVLHRDISENNLMIYSPEETDRVPTNIAEKYFVQNIDNTPELETTSVSRGILNDFDMAAMRGADGSIISDTTHHHLTGTRPFMAHDLLQAEDKGKPVTHLYRHDLESFLYVLIWAATHYRLSTGTLKVNKALAKWNLSGSEAMTSKATFMSDDLDDLKAAHCLPEFDELWESWISPLFLLFYEARGARHAAVNNKNKNAAEYDYTTYNGLLTFENFMATIKETPRGLNPVCDA